MNVRKRNGSLEPVDLSKILRAVTRSAEGISDVDTARVAVKTIGGLYDGATTEELDRLSIETAASLIPENPNYSKLAAAILAECIRKEVARNQVHTFSESVERARTLNLVSVGLLNYVTENAPKLNRAIKDEYNSHFEYFALKALHEKHLLRDPRTGEVIETPQYFLMRKALHLAFQNYSAVNQAHPSTRFVRLYKQLANDPKAELDTLSDPAEEAPVGTSEPEFVPYRPLKAGMGQAVAERTILRKKADGSWETWGDVATRVALGNSLLADTPLHPQKDEFALLRKHIANGNTLMSGRHLQHGDADQPTRSMEVYTNCATSSTAFLLFYLLLNGSGVGRAYDDDMMLVNWDYAPNIRCVIDSTHPDYTYGVHETLRDAKHKYGAPADMAWFELPATVTRESWQEASAHWEARNPYRGSVVEQGKTIWFQVPDSREGWAKAHEHWERLAFEKIHAGTTLILDFTPVRPKMTPIGGMQGRPSSGPAPLMNAFQMASTLKGAGMAPWRQTMYVDHFFAECVLVGGARRAARMSTKYWKDPTIFDFISVKRPTEYAGLDVYETVALRKKLGKSTPFSFLWSSNDSVAVDQEFWDLVIAPTPESEQSDLEKHAKAVFHAVCAAAYGDGTGEPGFINLHKLVQNDEGLKDLTRGDFVESDRYKLNDETQILMSRLAKRVKSKKFKMIVNPCGEICLSLLGAFCVIADFVPFHCDTIDEGEECVRAMVRALIRVNLMDSIYGREVRRTNRIGIGITGIHEFAWKFFGVGFRDLIADFDLLMADNLTYEHMASRASYPRAVDFWLALARFNRAANEEAISYSRELGVSPPHTTMTVKPSGSVSKLFSLTEGWHLVAMAYYLRWVQFRNDDPLIPQYQNNGYPTRQLKEYSGTTIVGFPTAPAITELGMGDKLVTAGEATPEEQFKWLMLGEKYWIKGTDEYGVPVTEDKGNQISYTLKYKPELVSFDLFKDMLMKYQGQVRCCSVMPQEDTSSYEYLPEQPVSYEEYQSLLAGLEKSIWKKAEVTEEIGREHLGCSATGACPVDFNSGDK
jgi:hypothetical protein